MAVGVGWAAERDARADRRRKPSDVPAPDRRLTVRDDANHLIAVVTREGDVITTVATTSFNGASSPLAADCPTCSVRLSKHTLDPRKMNLLLRERKGRPLNVRASEVAWQHLGPRG